MCNIKLNILSILIAIFIIFLEISALINNKDEKKDYIEKNEIEAMLENNIEENETINEIIDEEIVDTSKAEYTYSEMVDDLNLLNKKYKSYLELNVLGKTYDNRNIYEVILGNKDADKHFLIDGQFMVVNI